MFKQALACVQSHQSLHCSRPCAKLAYIRYILSVNAPMSLIVCSLARAFTALVHAKNGRTYIQSMLRRDLICMQSCQSLHCSRTYTKWVCLWRLLSVNAQTSLSMRAVLLRLSLLSHMLKKGVHTVYSSSQFSDAHEHVCSLARALTALTHAQNGRTYGIFQQSILRCE